MRAPLLAATWCCAAPLTSCDHSPLRDGRSAVGTVPAGRGPDARRVGRAAESAGRGSQRRRGAAERLGPPLWSDPAIDPASRLIIRTGQASIEVDSLEPALDLLADDRARGSAGSSATRTCRAGRNQLRPATLELKVPAGRFDDLTDGLRPLGRLAVPERRRRGRERGVRGPDRPDGQRAAPGGAAAGAAGAPGPASCRTCCRSSASSRGCGRRSSGWRAGCAFSRPAPSSAPCRSTLHEPPPLVVLDPGRNVIGAGVARPPGGISWACWPARLPRWAIVVPVVILGWGAVVAGRRLTRRPA